MITVRVPASSANLGPGFDSFGVALSLYNTIKVSEIEKGIVISNKNAKEFIPKGEKNLIYRAVNRAFDEVGYQRKGLSISQNSEIPMTRGMGSSSACIVGGLLAGNAISGRQLTMQRIFELANELEGHPDNVAPAIFGGFCISLKDGDRLYKKSIKIMTDIDFVAMVPEYYTITRKSRNLLENRILREDASFNIARASCLALALQTGDFSDLDLFLQDKLHQKQRSNFIPDLYDIIDASKMMGALGTFLSGSGPTIISIVKKDDNEYVNKLSNYFELHNIKREIKRMTIDNVGAILCESI